MGEEINIFSVLVGKGGDTWLSGNIFENIFFILFSLLMQRPLSMQ